MTSDFMYDMICEMIYVTWGVMRKVDKGSCACDQGKGMRGGAMVSSMYDMADM